MVVGGELGEAAAAHLLVKLGKLASHRCLAGAEHVRHVGEAGGEALRSLEEDQSGVEGGDSMQRLATGAAPGRQKAAEEEAVARQPGQQQIGRAAGRESVVQYVSIAGVAGSVKK